MCDECDDNYYSYDYGKTCEKVDMEYEGNDDDDKDDEGKDPKDSGKFLNFGWHVLGFLLCFVL